MAPRKVTYEQFEDIRQVCEAFAARLQAALQTSVTNALTTVLQGQYNQREAPGDVHQRLCVSAQADNLFFYNEADEGIDPLKEIIGDPIFDVYEDNDNALDDCVDNDLASVEKENATKFTYIQEMDPTLTVGVQVINFFYIMDDMRSRLTSSNLASRSQLMNSDPPDRGRVKIFLANDHREANSELLDHLFEFLRGCHDNCFLREKCEEPPDPNKRGNLFHRKAIFFYKGSVFYSFEEELFEQNQSCKGTQLLPYAGDIIHSGKSNIINTWSHGIMMRVHDFAIPLSPDIESSSDAFINVNLYRKIMNTRLRYSLSFHCWSSFYHDFLCVLFKDNDVFPHIRRGHNTNWLLPWVRSPLLVSPLGEKDMTTLFENQGSFEALKETCSLRKCEAYFPASFIHGMHQAIISKWEVRAVCSLQLSIKYTSATEIFWNEVSLASSKLWLYSQSAYHHVHEALPCCHSIFVAPASSTRFYLMVWAIARSMSVTLVFGVFTNNLTSIQRKLLYFGYRTNLFANLMKFMIGIMWEVFSQENHGAPGYDIHVDDGYGDFSQKQYKRTDILSACIQGNDFRAARRLCCSTKHMNKTFELLEQEDNSPGLSKSGSKREKVPVNVLCCSSGLPPQEDDTCVQYALHILELYQAMYQTYYRMFWWTTGVDINILIWFLLSLLIGILDHTSGNIVPMSVCTCLFGRHMKHNGNSSLLSKLFHILYSPKPDVVTFVKESMTKILLLLSSQCWWTWWTRTSLSRLACFHRNHHEHGFWILQKKEHYSNKQSCDGEVIPHKALFVWVVVQFRKSTTSHSSLEIKVLVFFFSLRNIMRCELCIARVLKNMMILSLSSLNIGDLRLLSTSKMGMGALPFTDRDVLHGLMVFCSCSTFAMGFTIYDKDPLYVVSTEDLLVRSCAFDIVKRSECGVNQVPDTEFLVSSKIFKNNINNSGIDAILSSYYPLIHQMEATVKLDTAYAMDFQNVSYHACKTRKSLVIRTMSIWIMETLLFSASVRCLMGQSSVNTWCVTSFVREAIFCFAIQEKLLSFWLHKEEFMVVRVRQIQFCGSLHQEEIFILTSKVNYAMTKNRHALDHLQLAHGRVQFSGFSCLWSKEEIKLLWASCALITHCVVIICTMLIEWHFRFLKQRIKGVCCNQLQYKSCRSLLKARKIDHWRFSRNIMLTRFEDESFSTLGDLMQRESYFTF